MGLGRARTRVGRIAPNRAAAPRDSRFGQKERLGDSRDSRFDQPWREPSRDPSGASAVGAACRCRPRRATSWSAAAPGRPPGTPARVEPRLPPRPRRRRIPNAVSRSPRAPHRRPRNNRLSRGATHCQVGRAWQSRHRRRRAAGLLVRNIAAGSWHGGTRRYHTPSRTSAARSAPAAQLLGAGAKASARGAAASRELAASCVPALLSN